MPTKIKKLLAASICAFSLILIPATAHAAAIGLPCTPTQGSGTASNTDLFTCVNNLYKYALVISAIAAVMMIIFAGYMYIFSGGSESKVGTAKSWIASSLLGITVLLTGFLLLKQINPSLLTIKNISPQQIAQQDWFVANDYTKPYAGGPGNGGYGKPINIGQWKDLINKYSQQYNLDPCILDTIVRKESIGGRADSIGHDGGATQGENFNAGSPPKHGLDWNHSHGIGLTQVTIFPLTHRYGKWPDPNTPARQMFGRWYTVAELLNPDTDMSISAKMMAGSLSRNSGDLESAFIAYNGSGPRARAYGADAMAKYNLCKANSGN